MTIFTKRFKFRWKGKCLLDDTLAYLKKHISKKSRILRFAIVDAKSNTYTIDASVEEL